MSIELSKGVITALVGDNGAGKSTLSKIICGATYPDDGILLLDEHPVWFDSPFDARRAGIEAVYQDLALAPDLDVATNLYLGREVKRPGLAGMCRWVDRKTMTAKSEAILEQLGIKVPSVRTPVGSLSGGQRQAVAIGRAVMWASTMVVLDEPTAALSVSGRAAVLDVIRRVRAAGIAVLLVSHSLPEVFEIADRIVVMRHGAKVAERPVGATTHEEVLGLMTGALHGEPQ